MHSKASEWRLAVAGHTPNHGVRRTAAHTAGATGFTLVGTARGRVMEARLEACRQGFLGGEGSQKGNGRQGHEGREQRRAGPT